MERRNCEFYLRPEEVNHFTFTKNLYESLLYVVTFPITEEDRDKS